MLGTALTPSYHAYPIIGEQNISLRVRVKILTGYNLICITSGQVARLEAKSAAAETAEEARRQYASVLIRANEMVESIKQAIVLLQIAKNAAAPDEPGAVKEFNGAIDALTKSGRGEVGILIKHSTFDLIISHHTMVHHRLKCWFYSFEKKPLPQL